MTAKSRTKLEAINGEVVSLVDDTDGLVLMANYYGNGSPCRTRFTVGESAGSSRLSGSNSGCRTSRSEGGGLPKNPVVKAEKSRWALIGAPDRIWVDLFQ